MTVSPRFKKQETVQFFLNVFYTKTRLSQDLPPDMELPKIFFSKILDLKNVQNNFFQNSANDRMTHFNISVAGKYRRGIDNQRKWSFVLKCKKIFKGPPLYGLNSNGKILLNCRIVSEL